MKKHIIGFVVVTAVLFATFFVGVQRNDIVGVWQGENRSIYFGNGGKCLIDKERLHYRFLGDGNVRLYLKDGALDCPYMVSFDGKSMYFNGSKYKKVAQSGVEKSIIEFLL